MGWSGSPVPNHHPTCAIKWWQHLHTVNHGDRRILAGITCRNWLKEAATVNISSPISNRSLGAPVFLGSCLSHHVHIPVSRKTLVTYKHQGFSGRATATYWKESLEVGHIGCRLSSSSTTLPVWSWSVLKTNELLLQDFVEGQDNWWLCKRDLIQEDDVKMQDISFSVCQPIKVKSTGSSKPEAENTERKVVTNLRRTEQHERHSISNVF